MNQTLLSNQNSVNIQNRSILNSSFLRKDEIEARDYQLSIAAKCIGKNYLVSIPTGLGKTIIAVLVVAKTLELYPEDSKIIFLAPTKPLIVQHGFSFKKLLTVDISETESILTGSINAERRQIFYQKYRILFFTPQTLRNDLLEERYDLKDACLIIFDEAHRASGKYAYCQIANLYKETNPSGNILALTASPGSNMQKIQTLCSNLHIPPDQIELRFRKDEDVKKYIKNMTILKIGVEMTLVMKEKLQILKEILKNKIKELSNFSCLISWYEDISIRYKNLEFLPQKSFIELNRELVNSIQNSRTDKNFDKDTYKALSVNAQIMKLYHMIKLVETQGLNSFLLFLKDMYKDSEKSSSSKATKILCGNSLLKKSFENLKHVDEYQNNRLFHPKLYKLIQVLREQLTKNPTSRVLVFTELRTTVLTIWDNLDKFSLFNPVKFVGQAKKSEKDTGLSQKEQISILEQFKNNKYNILISTSVAEEGLDIDECDLVVFFDAVPSEIRLIQRRGRTARKKDGKVILLYCIGTSDERYLNISMSKLKAMQKSLGKDSKKKIKSQTNKKLPKKTTLNQSKILEDEFLLAVERVQNQIDAIDPPKSKELTIIPVKKPIIPSLILNQNLSIKYGLRKEIGQKFSVKDLSSTHNKDLGVLSPDIVFKKILGVKILNSDQLFLFKEEVNYPYLEGFKNCFHLPIIFADFIGDSGVYRERKKTVTDIIETLDSRWGIQVIPIHFISDLTQILNPLLKNIITKQEKGK